MSTLDLGSFAVPDDFSERLPTSPKVRAPRSTEDVIVHDQWAQPVVLVVKIASKFFLVKNQLARLLAGHVFRAKLHAMASSDGEIAVWPAKVNTSAIEAANAAVGKWKKITWKNATKSYDIQDATQQHKAPDWRYTDLNQLIADAFAGQVLDDAEQPEVKKLLAENEGAK